MDPKAFNNFVKPLMRYSVRLEREYLKPQIKDCKHCELKVIDQRIVAKVYRFGSPQQHVKHTCKNCKSILYDESLKPKKHKTLNILEKESNTDHDRSC